MAHILVADDEEGVRSFVAEALALDGHDVEQAADGSEAVTLLAARAFDLLITDLRMPKLDGLSLLRKARAEQPDLEVIVLTAHGTVDTAVQAMREGAFDFVQKPISGPAELRLLARRALERRALLTHKAHSERQHQHDPSLTFGDPTMKPVVAAIEKVARTAATVLLLGESGTGKEVVAQAIHRKSPRASSPFVAVNCAALRDTLLESELFGHEKGSFTGAHAAHRGRIELAQGGTFFLDEIGELKPDLQAKLLRVLQERRFERVGGSRTIEADVRWIAATNRDLAEMMQRGAFREDLYHRISVFPIRLPRLRDRQLDIEPLARDLLKGIAGDLGRADCELHPDAAALLRGAPWPGNIRELRNVLERALILTDGSVIGAQHILLEPVGGGVGAPVAEGTLADLERQAIIDALAAVSGNRKLAAERLGIGLRTLYEKLKRYDLS